MYDAFLPVSSFKKNNFLNPLLLSNLYSSTQTFSLSLSACSSSDFPRLGSLCQVRVRLKANPDEAQSLVSEKGNEWQSVQPDRCVTEATAFPRCQDSVLQVPLGDWTTLRLGEGQCDITEACVEGMRAGEKCEVRV